MHLKPNHHYYSRPAPSAITVPPTINSYEEEGVCEIPHICNQEELLMAQERYKDAKKEAKEAATQVKEKAYEELYKKLDSKEGANDIFRIAKARERRRRDVGDIRFIKDEGELDGHEEVEDPCIVSYSDCYYSRINKMEVRIALQKMGRNKAVGPDQIPLKAWRCLGDKGITWLASLFNKTFTSAKMPEE
ncbi:hypothetical protein Tco_1057073 [Tanacetum coccineum]|uniref:Uncharacterized protein n=1 Tax=Tanacetum coccineum TaxID=301880 RepID=A0ABQ5H4H0_9ASTR